MKLQVFDGGLNTKLRPQYLQANQATVYENLDNDPGSLTPVKVPLDTGIQVQPYHVYFNAAQEWVSSAEPRDYVEFNKVLYWSDRVTRPQKYDGSTQSNLGIDVPNKITNITKDEFVEQYTDYSIVSTTDPSMGLTNTIQYYLLRTIKNGNNGGVTYLSVATNGRVSTLNDFITDLPEPRRVTTDDSGVKRVITFKEVESLAAGGELEIYRWYKETWRLVDTIQFGGTIEVVDDDEDISGNAAFDENDLPPLVGTFTYLMTYYNDTVGIESGPSDVSDEVDLSLGGTITLAGLSISSDPQVDLKRIYRVGGNIANFTLVEEIPNSQTTFVDDVKDTDVEGSFLPSTSAGPAPTGLSFLIQAYAMLFGAVEDQVRFTPINEPDSWPETFFIQYEEPITGLAPVANGILVFTKFKTHIITGTGPLSLSTYPLSGDQGCIAYESVQLLGTEAIWASTDGICRSSGNRPSVLTKPIFGKLVLDPVDSAVYDETYYLLESDGSILALGDAIARRFNLGVESLEVALDELHGYRSSTGTLWQLFRGEENAEFKYTSPRFVEGSFTDNKTYKKIFVYSKGHVIINIIIDDQVVQTRELTTEDSHQIQVPQELQRGFFIQFEIEGTGEVYEIEYQVGLQ